MENDVQFARNLKWFLPCFEGMSGMRITYHKSDLMTVNLDEHSAEPRACPPLWKGVTWAAKAAEMGYRWQIRNGDKIIFWSDVSTGNCSLAILYWDLFSIISEQESTVAQVCYGINLKFTFRRYVCLP